MKFQALRMSSILLTGLIAGTFFYGGLTVLPTFFDVKPYVHLTFRTMLMRYNAPVVMTLVMIAIIAQVLYSWQVRKINIARIFVWLSLALTISSLLITRIFSVPINIVIKTWNPSSPPADWMNILATWNVYNTIRTFTSLGSFLFIIIADFWIMKMYEPKKVLTN
jgi:uncharacterized membrane protein